MIAIQTKSLRATNTKGERIKAFTYMGAQITIANDLSLTSLGAHAKAAVALARKNGWTYGGKLISGGIKDGFIFVFTNDASFDV